MGKIKKPIQSYVSTEELTLRIFIDSNWTLNDFAKFFKSTDKLTKYYSVIQTINECVEQAKTSIIVYNRLQHSSIRLSDALNYLACLFSIDDLSKSFGDVDSLHKLKIVKIKYESPGFTDLIGIANVIGHLKDTIFHYIPSKKEKIESEILIQQRNKLIIENLKELEIPPETIRQILLQEELNINVIRSLIEQKKIISSEILEEKII